LVSQNVASRTFTSMKASYSNSLMLAWQVADLEAKHLQAAFLEPAHLLLGLCKCVDIDVPGSVPAGLPERERLIEELLREFRRLREVFHSAGFDAMRFRRHYRTVLPEGSAGLTPPLARLHRNDAARDVVSEAERIAAVSGGIIYPIHLLYSLLAEDDPQREKAMAAVGLNEARLREVVKQQLFPHQKSAFSGTEWPNPQWN
jgi:ATP-dependent Clp protease ATP-binding subunit ClpC